MTAICAIVGRPNVGKSTLFNRLVGSRRAIESSVSGTTRDRIHYKLLIQDRELTLVDTGGIELDVGEGSIESQVQEQSKVAIEGADLILWVVDVRHDLTSEDYHALALLRKSKKPVYLIANKCDNPKMEDGGMHLYSLGLSKVLFVSALHAHGLYELEDALYGFLKENNLGEKIVQEEGAPIRLAMVGRPNVGKSTMLNALMQKQVVVTSDVPGTTRDRVDVELEWNDQKFVLIDTAGIRRRGKIDVGLEKYSVLRTFRAISESDICILLLDPVEGITAQDCHVSEYALNEGKGLVLVANKMDLFKGEEREEAENQFIYKVKRKMAYVPWAPLVFSSALKGKHVEPILELAVSIQTQRTRQIPQEELTAWLRQSLLKHQPKGQKGKKQFNVLQVEQVGVQPPHFIFACEAPELRHFSYERFLENQMREVFGFGGTALWLTLRDYRKMKDDPKREQKK